MPLIENIRLDNGGIVGVWNIEEDHHYFLSRLQLNKSVQEEYNKIHSTKQLEWLASRYLVFALSEREVNPTISKDEYGKPFLAGSEWYISLSHTRGMAAVIASPHKVGIDIQVREKKMERIASKFLSKEEHAWIKSQNNIDDLYHFYWGAKESMYKAYGKKKLQFNEHIFVDQQSEMSLGKGNVLKEQELYNYKVFYKMVNKSFLVYVIEN